jgi:hypothetical protein
MVAISESAACGRRTLQIHRGLMERDIFSGIVVPRGRIMKLATIAVTAGLLLIAGGANAQTGVPSGRGSTSGDPAASSATPGTAPTTGSSMKPNRSESGMSTSGGSDANGDQGRDKMPDSSQGVRPLNKQNKPE